MSAASQPVATHWDEMTLPSGEPRPHWLRLLRALEGLGPAELLRRWHEAQRLIRENGVTYNVYGDPQGMDRPWQLDPIPLLITGDEWAEIAAAVAQRAELLDRVLADLYGPQRLLREGLLPASFVFAHPGFLRPCHGLRLAGGRHLHVYAADLARAPDGRWWVIADRTQAPSGSGYALENRVVLSRILPEPFRDFHVQRLAGFFQALRDGLAALSPRPGEPPRVVLLTPGPYNETYFEHAYLARYLGYTLVDGSDLTVREEKVWLKTLDGLLPVDVILRRQDDDWCDSLELHGESTLGVPGLVQAVRRGHVAVANALGSGLLESSATMAFLPGLCSQLLSEELRMPSVATWWCGQERERAYVSENLHHLVLKPTWPRGGEDVIFGAELDAAGREALRARLAATPERFTAQEQVTLSTAPTGADDAGPAPRHLVLRVFAAVGADGAWVVMPGGLTRVSTSAESLVVSSQRGGGSKDTWVLADAPVPYVTLMERVRGPIDVRRAGALTSRVADDLLWLGRTGERLEASLRLFRCALRRLAEEPLRATDAPLPDPVELLEQTRRIAARAESEPPVSLEERILAALFDRERAEAPGAAVRQLQRLASRVRDRLSSDAWRAIQRLDQEFREAPGLHPALRVSFGLDLLDRALLSLSALTGLVMESMTRTLGWQFLDLGRRLERGIQVVELLQAGLARELPRAWRRLESVLEVADSAMTYRSRYQTWVQPALVLDLLLCDESNPRALAYQLVQLDARFEALPKAPRRALRALLRKLREADVDALAVADADGLRAELDALLVELLRGLPGLFDGVNHAYLTHALPHRRGRRR